MDIIMPGYLKAVITGYWAVEGTINKAAQHGRMCSFWNSLTPLQGALVRVLREEGRKNIQLRLNTVSTFLIFSFFQNFHQVCESEFFHAQDYFIIIFCRCNELLKDISVLNIDFDR